MRVLAVLVVLATVSAGCLGGILPDAVRSAAEEILTAYEPHVLVAIPDTGINPYHEIYYRPDRTAHPCTYVRDFPCDLPALELTLGGDDWDAAFEADADAWAAVEPDTWYWIPKTVFVAVSCSSPSSTLVDSAVGDEPAENVCVLDDTHMHGTGTTSSVLMENPDALIAFREGGPYVEPFIERELPVDVFSVSWGFIAPVAIPSAASRGTPLELVTTPLYVKSAGNNPSSTAMDGWSGNPDVISVGGAYASGRTEEPSASKQPDVVSYYCRPVAQTKETEEMRESYCGTSFAAPTVAGALSKVVLAIRRASGYDGGTLDGVVDPVHGLTIAGLREALNLTATYEPDAEYDNSDPIAFPLNPAAPWLQWGWGFYDGAVADATVAHLLGEAPAPEKSAAARQYMDAVHAAKRALYG